MLAAVLAVAVAPPAPPSFAAGVELVRVDVTALDARGVPIEDLTAADFEIKEGGRRLEIVSFEPVHLETRRSRVPEAPAAVSTPRVPSPAEGHCYAIFFDDVHVGSPTSEWVRRELARFLAEDVREGDWVTLVAPEEHVFWTARDAAERSQLLEIARRLSGQFVRDPFAGSSDSRSLVDYPAMLEVEYGSRTGADAASRGGPDSGSHGGAAMLAEAQYATAQRRIRTSLAALKRTVQAMAGVRGRKAVFVLSEGFIRAPRLEGLYDEIVALARRLDVSLHFINPRGLLGAPLDTEGGGLWHLAHETGGRALLSNDILGPVREALAESASYYLIGFVPASAKPGEHRVQVRVRRAGVRLGGRIRYYLGESSAPGTAPEVAVLASIADATGLDLRLSTRVEEAAGERRIVVLDVELGETTGGAVRRYRLRFVGRRGDDGRTVEGSSELAAAAVAGGARRVSARIELDAGTWQLHVVLVDLESGALGSVVRTLEVPR